MMFSLRSVANRPIASSVRGCSVARFLSTGATPQPPIPRDVLLPSFLKPTQAAPRLPAKDTMPPGFRATVGNLETFHLPSKVTGSLADHVMAEDMLRAWRRDGILQIGMTDIQRRVYEQVTATSKRFFSLPPRKKHACVDEKSYAGYIASGEEITDGIADYSEIFTVTKDLPLSDKRVKDGWPCHGPCPWPDTNMKMVVQQYMNDLGNSGQKLLQLIELGLGVAPGSLTNMTQDGWHHLRVLRFPSCNKTNGKGRPGRGIGSHTDYGLLVIAAQDEIGGLFVRPPSEAEKFANWEKSAAGLHEDTEGWVYVPPVPGTFTVFPGDMLQYMTNSFLPSTPHKVGLNTRERFAFAYFHEPNFRAVVKPLEGYKAYRVPTGDHVEGIHYGTHFTNMFLRNYPERITTKKLLAEDRYKLLSTSELCEAVA